MWLSAAADCLELFPDQLIVFAAEQLSQHGGDALSEERAETQKRLLFEAIAKFYGGSDQPPFLSGQHLDIHAAILHLLGKYMCECEDLHFDISKKILYFVPFHGVCR